MLSKIIQEAIDHPFYLTTAPASAKLLFKFFLIEVVITCLDNDKVDRVREMI